jgi:zinc transporter 11
MYHFFKTSRLIAGLAVGVGFGSVGASEAATFESAYNLAVGIALQNFPEG